MHQCQICKIDNLEIVACTIYKKLSSWKKKNVALPILMVHLRTRIENSTLKPSHPENNSFHVEQQCYCGSFLLVAWRLSKTNWTNNTSHGPFNYFFLWKICNKKTNFLSRSQYLSLSIFELQKIINNKHHLLNSPVKQHSKLGSNRLTFLNYYTSIKQSLFYE